MFSFLSSEWTICLSECDPVLPEGYANDFRRYAAITARSFVDSDRAPEIVAYLYPLVILFACTYFDQTQST